jgi:hypothetical protein
VTVRHSLPGVVELGTSLKGFRVVARDDEVLTGRELAGSQGGVKHFVPKRNGTSPEAHRPFIHKS